LLRCPFVVGHASAATSAIRNIHIDARMVNSGSFTFGQRSQPIFRRAQYMGIPVPKLDVFIVLVLKQMEVAIKRTGNQVR
jgi:hypothetical protein